MATFKRTGTIGTFRTKMIENMVARNYPRDFAERCFSQIEGFGEYGFPESHAASFALLVYASAWLKCHYPDAFAAALLNSQPMGFYAPAQIVRDLREHGVEVRPVDINHSDWDATLEPAAGIAGRMHVLHHDMECDIRSTHALRLGFRNISGLPQEEAQRIVAGRRSARRPETALARLPGEEISRPDIPYTSLHDLWLRSGLSPCTIERLADADAFGSLGLSRRQALWAAKALGRVGDQHDDLPLFRAPASPATAAAAREPVVALPSMSPGEEVVNDYRYLSLSLRRHPATFLRADLALRGILRNEDLRLQPAGTHVTVSGLVTIRQRPGSANGVIFMTIEDESGIANIIVWPNTFERFRPIVLGARYVAVHGQLQQESGVVHVVATRLDDLTSLLARLTDDQPPITALARADEIKRPHDANIDRRARGRQDRIRSMTTKPSEALASDLDVPAHGSAHAPSRRGGSRIARH
jgi:error-prone DNA polymerase